MSKTDDLPDQDPEEGFTQNLVASAYGPRWSDRELVAQIPEMERRASLEGVLKLLWKLRKMPLKEMHAFYRSLEGKDAYEMEKLAAELGEEK